mgnify:CR=1 FL=1
MLIDGKKFTEIPSNNKSVVTFQRAVFENLKISDSTYMSEQGKYPVIFISLKDLKENSWEECLESLKDIMYKVFNEYEFLREKLNLVEKRQFDKIWEITGNERNFKTNEFKQILRRLAGAKRNRP